MSSTKVTESVIKSIQHNAIPIHRTAQISKFTGERKQYFTSTTAPDYDAILNAIGPNTKVVMIGEASHGTEEFYRHRAEITKRLISEMGFNVVAVEADWPDTYRVNRYIRDKNGKAIDQSAHEALSNFQRFPRWMWRNTVVEEFVEWMKSYNQQQQQVSNKVGFYGLDMYSFNASRNAVLSYLDKVDPESARRTRNYYACFDQYGDEINSSYSWAVGLNLSHSCHEPCERALRELIEKGNELIKKDTEGSFCGKKDRLFYAQQNARVVKGAEEYYRNMLSGSHVTWNIRDNHMCTTLWELMNFLSTDDGGAIPEPKAVIWAHNSHLGDASQTDAGWEEDEVIGGEQRKRRRRFRGGKEVNLGQLIRQKWGMDKTFSIGFSTYTGKVTAAYDWDEEPQTFKVKDSLKESWEYLLHTAGTEMKKPISQTTPEATMTPNAPYRAVPYTGQDYTLIFRSNDSSKFRPNEELLQELNSLEPRIQRAIGVCYRPETERQSHYFGARLPRQFDAMIHLEVTKELQPLDKLQAEGGITDETFPTGL